jgi:translin
MPELEAIVDGLRERLAAKNAARERALGLCREAVRASANAIRAIHRHDVAAAEGLIGTAGAALNGAVEALADHGDVLHAGFVHDAAKEYVEARCTLAIVRDDPLPRPDELGVDPAAYLNGLAEAVGELRRHLLDYLRVGEVDRCERLLDWMDEIYGQLVTIDYPDAMTGGLRRATDAARAILERTRGDLTIAIRQRELEVKMDSLAKRGLV